MKKTNIIFGSSTFITMKENNLLNNNIIEFFSVYGAIFSIANLSKIDNYEVLLPKGIYLENINHSFKNKINKLDEAINNNEDIRVWTSHYDIESYLLFLYLCNYLKDKDCNIYVVYSDEYNEYCYSPACLKSDELEELAKLEHKLTKEEKIKFSEEWMKIQINTSDMRVIENNEVKLVSFDYYNNKILEILSNLGKVKISRLVATFMKDFYLSDLIVTYLVTRLIENDKIKVVSYGDCFFENVIDENI